MKGLNAQEERRVRIEGDQGGRVQQFFKLCFSSSGITKIYKIVNIKDPVYLLKGSFICTTDKAWSIRTRGQAYVSKEVSSQCIPMSWRAFESIKRFNLLKIGAGWGDDTTTRRSNGIFSGQRQCRLTKCVLEITGFRWSLEVISCSYHTPELKLRHDKYKTVIFGPNMGIKISKIYDAVLGTHWTTIASRLLVGIAILGRALPGIGRSA